MKTWHVAAAALVLAGWAVAGTALMLAGRALGAAAASRTVAQTT